MNDFSNGICDEGEYYANMDFQYRRDKAHNTFKSHGFVITCSPRYNVKNGSTRLYYNEDGKPYWTMLPSCATVFRSRKEANEHLSKFKFNSPQILRV